MSCKVIPLDTRRFVTVAESDPCWAGEELDAERFRGAFVRVRPPRSASPDKVGEVERRLAEHALAVKVERHRKGAVVVQRRGEEKNPGLREAAVSAAKATRSRDAARLSALVERILTEEGL